MDLEVVKKNPMLSISKKSRFVVLIDILQLDTKQDNIYQVIH